MGSVVTGRALQLYVTASVVWIAAYWFQPPAAKPLAFLVTALGAIPAVGYGLRRVQPGRRLPWWLLLTALSVLSLGLVVRLGDHGADALGVLLNAAGNLLILAAAVALILRHARTDIGGVIDASIIGVSVGAVLSIIVFALADSVHGIARLNLFVVLFALSGVLGALVRISTGLTQPVAALRWLMLGLACALAANVVASSIADPAATNTSDVLFMAAYTSVGAFGLHPSAPRLVRPGFVDREDTLTGPRLVFLGAAVAAAPMVVGVLILLSRSGTRDGLVLLIGSAPTAALVMLRIGRLSADRARTEFALRQQATVDPLTGLPNRRTFMERLTEDLSRHERCTVLFCDLDGFKSVNDRWGHSAGDELLAQAGARLASAVRQGDTVSRFGGDEFLVLLPGATPANVDAIIERIQAAFAQAFRLSVGELALGASIGIAVDAEGSAEALIGAADAGMYEAKQSRGPTPSTRVATR